MNSTFQSIILKTHNRLHISVSIECEAVGNAVAKNWCMCKVYTYDHRDSRAITLLIFSSFFCYCFQSDIGLLSGMNLFAIGSNHPGIKIFYFFFSTWVIISTFNSIKTYNIVIMTLLIFPLVKCNGKKVLLRRLYVWIPTAWHNENQF